MCRVVKEVSLSAKAVKLKQEKNYCHAVFHYGCKSCFQIIQCIPCFNFSALDIKKKNPDAGCFDNNSDYSPYFVWPDHKLSVKFTDMWCSKRTKWLRNEEDDTDMWCRHCNLLFWSFDALVKHMKSHHLFTKTFRHYWKIVSNQKKAMIQSVTNAQENFLP